jgi:hypothetical protein
VRTPRFNSRSGIDRDEAARERRLAASLNVVADGVLSPSGNVADLPLTGDTMLAVLQGGKLLSATVDDVGDVIGSGGGGGGISASAVMVRGLGC